MKLDIYRYAGAITSQGYSKICQKIQETKRGDAALLIIGTPGGDPHAGFRIARALQHSYQDGFSALIPRYCKSAGTLVLMGARKLYMADQSELGPLDVQIKKGDELYSRSSGLDINQAVNFLKAESFASFNMYMDQFVRQGLSTKFSAEIAVKLVNGIFNPIAAQIDPFRLAEMQRATTITLSYGQLLSASGKNIQPDGLETLVGGYPSHGFVIDRKEARRIFAEVDPPTGSFLEMCQAFQKQYGSKVNDGSPTVTFEEMEIVSDIKGEKDGQLDEIAGQAKESSAAQHPIVSGNGAQNRRGKAARKPRSARAPSTTP